MLKISKGCVALLLVASLVHAADKKGLTKKRSAPVKPAPTLDLSEPAPAPPVEAPPAEVKPVIVPPVANIPEVARAVSPLESKHVFSAEVGLSGYNRSFDYFGARGAELRRYAMPFYPLLTARGEYFPLRARKDVWSQLAVEIAGNIAPWLRTQDPSGTSVIATFNARLDAGANVRLAPVAKLPLTLIPALALRYHVYSMGGTDVRALPNATYLGVRVGLGGEYAFLEKFTAFTRLAVLPMFYSGEIFSRAFFSGGSNVGLEGSLGIAMQVKDMFEARLSFDYTSYLFRLRSNPAVDRYNANGAFDQYLGASLSARKTF
ncbi:MAG: hypothetical protein K1X64_08400 [Myxococcaceae bacterium]|nr:hypothetical protein [Myxococcaceae bacterium]